MANYTKSPLPEIKLRGANLEALYDYTHELILSGRADTGKSVALCVKHIILATQIPKLHGALVRKTYKSLGESVVKTMNRMIPGLGVQKFGGKHLDRYIFPNESEIVLVGMDKPDRLLSSE